MNALLLPCVVPCCGLCSQPESLLMHNSRPVSLLICALGGEGGGVLTAWLVEVARVAGFAAQSTSIPGVAQRTGATTYFIEVFPVPQSALGGRQPVFSLNPIPGALDAVISSELLETARCASNGLPSPERTMIITSSSRTLTTLERSHLGDGRLNDAALLQIVQSACRAHHVLDMQAIARTHGTAVSAVMLGAIAASGLFPFPKEAYLQVVRASGRSAAASVAGFEAAWQVMEAARAPAQVVQQLLSEMVADTAPMAEPDVAAGFPATVAPLLRLGHARAVAYQDAAYGALYLQRLTSVLHAEQQADPDAAHAHQLTEEMARWVALWMAFDDIVRVAELKSRRTRSLRVRDELKVGASDLLKVYEHFKPGVPEFAAMLPTPLAERLTDWQRKRIAAGEAAWALPIKLGSHTVLGMLALRALALMKHLRPYGSRFGVEQDLIMQWHHAVLQGVQEDWQLGYEIAQCGRLIKGYGSTNERGKHNLLHVITHLAQPSFGTPVQRAAAIRQAREAALQDEAGNVFDQTLVKLGAPPRPLKAQPIRWMPRTK